MQDFELCREDLLEMKSLFYCNTVFNQDKLQFRVFEFVDMLNGIVGKSNLFSRLDAKDIEKRRQ